MAAQDYVAVVQQLYVSYFGRPADYYGLQSFEAQLDALKAPTDFAELNALVQKDKAGTTALSKLVNSFNSSAESAALYGTDNSTIGVSKFVAAIYENVLGREADVEGLTFWVNEILAGRLTRANAAMAITDGALANTTDQGKLDAKTVENKLAVATNFTDALDTTNEINGFAGDKAAAQARDLLDGVTSSTDVTAYQATVDATIAAIAQGTVVTTNHILTAGADTIVGTSANDVITALTVNASGAAATTFSSFDSIDGGAGNDSLSIYIDDTANLNDTFGTSTVVKNVETVNLLWANTTVAAFGDASKYEGVTTLNQVGAAAAVTNLAATTTAGFKNVDANISVAPAAGAASATIALDQFGEGRTIAVDGSAASSALATVTVSGTVKDTDASGSITATALNVSAGKNVTTVTVNTAVKTTLGITDNAASTAGTEITTVDLSGSTGAVTYNGTVTGGTAGAVATIKGGSGNDVLTIVTATLVDDATTTANETVSASLVAGAGNDTITINTSGTGTTTVDAGDGKDDVTFTADGTGKLTVNLGAGDDAFHGAGAVSGTDVIDGGAGTDTLLLNMVGSANIGAFTNFEAFDALALGKTLDVDILAAKNTVTEFVASGDVSTAAALVNVGAGVSFRATGNMTNTANHALTLTQKTAGALTLTLDVDSTSTSAQNDAFLQAIASNATSIKAVFGSDSGYVQNGGNLNDQTMIVTGSAATSLDITSGGANATNVMNYTYGKSTGSGTPGLLTAVTISGDKNLTLNLSDGTNDNFTKVATINASSFTGNLTTDLDNLKATGTLTLGSGDDSITAHTGLAATSTAAADAALAVAAMRTIAGIEKGTAEDSTLQSNYDVVKLAGAVQAADVAATATHTVKDGLFTFNGAGPATLADAVALVAGVIGVNETVTFEYVGNSYVFAEGATDGGTGDVLIQLSGVTGLKGLDAIAAGSLYVF